MILVPYNMIKKTLKEKLSPADAAEVLDTLDSAIDASPVVLSEPPDLVAAKQIISELRILNSIQAAELARLKLMDK